MKRILLLTIFIIAGYQGWNKYSYVLNKPEPLYEEPYVVVYGRNSCGFTQQTIKDLKKAGIPFEYENIDDRSTADLLHSRMSKSGIETRRYNLPVVDVSNDITIRPKVVSIIEKYDASSL